MVRDHKNRLICRMDVLALLVVTFVVLVIFMTLPPPHGGTSVDLARVRHSVSMSRASREDAIIIAVQRDGKIFFRTDPVLIQQLPGKILKGIREGAESKIYIRADARAKYGAVVEVIDTLHDVRLQNVAFLVDQARPTGN